MKGPTQLIPYALIRVQHRFAKDKTIGAFLMEPTFTRVSFRASDGRIEMHRPFPTTEIAEALREVDDAIEDGSLPAHNWLGGIAGAFDQQWGELQIVDRKTLHLESLDDLPNTVAERLRLCLDEQDSAATIRG